VQTVHLEIKSYQVCELDSFCLYSTTLRQHLV